MLAVAPDARRRGLGAELMAATLVRARAYGLTRIVLSTEVSRHAVHRLYEGLGYARLPERDWTVEGFALIAYGLDVD
jgi:ribosomal protein S18 acetylase RimI-like enzyme